MTTTNHLDGLNQRLTVIRDRVRLVASGRATGYYLFGRPGTSKTYTVRRALKDNDISHHYTTGHVTPLGLFETLKEYPEHVIVLDDVGALFNQQIGLQILLAALGNQASGTRERLVEYRRAGHVDRVHFKGGLILISNLDLHDGCLLDALRSRVHVTQYDPSDEQIAALMRHVGSQGWPAHDPSLTPSECEEVIEYLVDESTRMGIRLDMRLLCDKALPDYEAWVNDETEANWKDLVSASLEERLVELRHSLPPQPTHRQQRARDLDIMREILDICVSQPEQIAEWISRTGKGERTFYRRFRQLMPLTTDATVN